MCDKKKSLTDEEVAEAALFTIDRWSAAETPDEAERLDLRFQGLWRILLRRRKQEGGANEIRR